MDRRQALAKIQTIVDTHLELIKAECGERGAQAVQEAVADLQGLVHELFDDLGDGTEQRDPDAERGGED